MAAIFRRRRTGKGQFIEVAMRDGLTQLIGESLLDYALNKRVQQRNANRHPYRAPHGVYRCTGEDSWLAVSVWDDAEWGSLCRAIGRPDLVADGRFETMAMRKANETEVNAVISSWSASRDHQEAARTLQAAGVRAAPVMTTREIAHDPQFSERAAFPEVELHGQMIRLGRVGWTAEHLNTPVHRAPDYSEHTREVLRDLAGLSDEEIDGLAAIGAIALPAAGQEGQ